MNIFQFIFSDINTDSLLNESYEDRDHEIDEQNRKVHINFVPVLFEEK